MMDTGTGTTAEDTALEVGLDPKRLDQEFPIDNVKILSDFSKLIVDWNEFANSLGLLPPVRRGIEVNVNLTYPMKVQQVFREWKKINGMKGTYRLLIDACLRLGDENLAKEMCKLGKCKCVKFIS